MKIDIENTTPMMKQYLSIKKDYPNILLFYRMGDFYEVFFQDAIKASNLLEITLTHRGKNNGKNIEMAGVPANSLDNYLSKLIKKGESVAICDQVEDAKNAKGIVKREVVRLITPGTISEENFLNAKQSNIILSIFRKGMKAGLAYFEISDTEINLVETSFNSFKDEVYKLDPKEILISEKDTELIKCLKKDFYITKLPEWNFYYETCKLQLKEHFQSKDLKFLEKFNLCEKNNPHSLTSLGALLSYLKSTQKQNLFYIDNLKFIQNKGNLIIDFNTRKNLELEKTLSGNFKNTLCDIIDKTKTSMGSRLLKNYLKNPSRNFNILEKRYTCIEILQKNQNYLNLQEMLNSIFDIERIISRILLNTIRPPELIKLKESLKTLPKIKLFLKEKCPNIFEIIKENFYEENHILELLEKSIKDLVPQTIKNGGVIKDDYNDELQELINIRDKSHNYLVDFENKEKDRLKISSLKISYNKINGYFIEIPKTHNDKIPKDYIRRQTLKNNERYTTEKLTNFEHKVLSSSFKALQKEKTLYQEILNYLGENLKNLQKTSKVIAFLDVMANFAERAFSLNLSKPSLKNKRILNIKNGRHLVVENLNNKTFIPNNTNLNNDNNFMVITGPNMGGKSTFMRQNALIIILAYIGSFVPAKKAIIGDFDRIFTRIGANDDLSQEKSTFMVEMLETSCILNNATEKSLVLIDEIGRGTSTFDGLALALSIADKLYELKCFTFFATHYFEITKFSYNYPKMINYYFTALENGDDIIFLYEIKEGEANKSYGISVAKLAGIENKVIKNAKRYLKSFEKEQVQDFNLNQKDLFLENELQNDDHKEAINYLQHLDPDDLSPKLALKHLYNLIKLVK